MKKTAPKSGDEMSNAELAAELTLVMKGKRRPSTMNGYVEEVELPNGHIWRKKKSGAWCRFSIKGFCLLGQKTDPLIESLIENDLQKSVNIAEFLQQNPQGGTPQNIDHIIQSLETPQVKQQLAQLEAQGFTLLFRGQGFDSLGEGQGIISPVARTEMDGTEFNLQEGLAHSEAFYKQLVQDEIQMHFDQKIPLEDIPHNVPQHMLNEAHSNMASMTARYNGHPYYGRFPESFIDSRLGGTGIPTTRLMGIAASPEFAQVQGVIYVLKAPSDIVTKVPKKHNPLHQEQEHVIFNQIPLSSVYGVITPEGFPTGFKVDELGGTDKLILAQ